MTETQLAKGSISFQTEGRLLQELGERLVAKPEVALVEIVKNAYDADASICEVQVTDKGKSIAIRDDGLGMTLDQFSKRWMRIATAHKLHEIKSAKFKRRLTGQKGIGRFAVRFLGKTLVLDSIAWDETRKCLTHLKADFDWEELDKQQNLDDAKIPYRLTQADPSSETGTTLTISNLRNNADFSTTSNFRTSILKIVSPIAALDGGRFKRDPSQKTRDPGFHVRLPGDEESPDGGLDIAGKVLAHAWARLKIDLTGDALIYELKFHDGQRKRLRHKFKSHIGNGAIADICFFPRRAGVFREAGVDVFHFTNAEVIKYGPSLIERLMPPEIAQYWKHPADHLPDPEELGEYGLFSQAVVAEWDRQAAARRKSTNLLTG